jgi:HPt (histidine-containing phosphotransfer) domain-containing protein
MPEPGIVAPLLDRETLEELRGAVGPGRLPRLIQVFVEETRARIARIIASNDIQLIEDEAHTLKAAAGTFGALALRDAAAKLEIACRKADAQGRLANLAMLPGLVDRTLTSFPVQPASRVR